MPELNDIYNYHAHVYFDADTIDQARTLFEEARDKFGLEMGRMHERLVGPHFRWSCQLIVPVEAFAIVIPWLNLKRNGLTIFVHPSTGDHLYDHRDAAMWLGDSVPVNFEMFLP
ncbi:MAG: DOPA 4,5-dioxygenase family protein [Alphaproteobacteria bacterium]|nr:DOPA 4,5-dioxygenase family protein [Alphaproteobacteria bacterium]